MNDACIPRSRENYLSTIALLKVETNPIYEPSNGLTWCNRFVTNATAELECEIPFKLANAQCDWLNDIAGHEAGWFECSSPVLAGLRAESGFPTVAVWRNLAQPPHNHGHIAMVVPALSGEGLHIAQAGEHNYNNAPIARGFGALRPMFFSHD